MSGLFSSFDPQASFIYTSLPLNWGAALGSLLLAPSLFWVGGGQVKAGLSLLLKALLSELAAVFGRHAPPGTCLIFVSLFIFLLGGNFLGLFPYVFTASSHLVFTLALALPLWLGAMVWSVTFQFNYTLAHLVPPGTPSALLSAMVLIETVSSLIRPLTLSIRLAANMIAGHLLLTLLGGAGSGGSGLGIIIMALVALLVLECAVACIQSYVFMILGALYLSETLSMSLSQKML